MMKNWMLQFIRSRGFFGILLLAAYPNAAFDLCGICCGHSLMPFWEFFGATLIGKGVIKVSGQAAFFIAIFREGSRERVFNALEHALPSRLPLMQHFGMADGGTTTPAQALRRWVNGGITDFQSGVAHRAKVASAAAAAAQRSNVFPASPLDGLLYVIESIGSPFVVIDKGRRSFLHLLRFMSPWRLTMAVMVGSFVKNVVEQVALAYAAERDEDALLQKMRAWEKKIQMRE